jgi:hypothetical protein
MEGRGGAGKKGGKAKRGVAKEKDEGSAYPAQALIKKAEELVEEYNYELAQRFYEKALSQEPSNTQVRHPLRSGSLCFFRSSNE